MGPWVRVAGPPALTPQPINAESRRVPMSDVAFVLLTVVLFAALTLALRGVERL